MIKIEGIKQFESVRRDLAKIEHAMIKEEAAAVNVAARRARKLTLRASAQRTRLSSRYLGRRMLLRRADARRRKLFARLRVFGSDLFSASYRDMKRGGRLIAKALRRGGVRLGGVYFPGAWIGYSARYGRHYVGRRGAGGVEYPGVHIGGIINSLIAASERLSARIIEAEMSARIDKLKRRYW